MSQDEISAPKNIMVCVDGSEISQRAANFGIALADRLRCKIFFVNVVGAEVSEKNYSIPADMVGSFETVGEEALAKCKEKASMKNLDFETAQVSGDPAEEILKFAKEATCDCIVLGKRGSGRVEKLLLESVSEDILKQSDIPVIVVK